MRFMTYQNRFKPLTILTILLLSSTSLLMAQTGKATVKKDGNSEQGSNQKDEVAIVEAIVVKGEKTERSLTETVSSVRVSTEAELKQADIRDVYNLLNRTANVTSRYGDNGFTIRGIDAVDVSGGGFNGLASVYVDGSVLGRRAIEGGAMSTWDMEQVEIFRGPQSTSQGRNALAGSIFLRSKQPTFQTNGSVKLSGGDAGDKQLAFAYGSALVEGKLAFRVSAEGRENDGFVYNPNTGLDADASESKNYRAKLFYLPSDELSFLFTITRTSADKGWDSQRSDVDDPFENRLAPFDIETYNDYTTDIASLETAYTISETWSLTSVTSFNQGEYDAQFDNDLSNLALGSTVRGMENKNLTQDLRFNYNSPRFNALVGVYAASLKDDDGYNGSVVLSSAGMGIPSFLLDFYPTLLQADTTSMNRAETRNIALYTDFTYEFSDRWSLVGGLRYDRETFDLELNNTANLLSILPNPEDYAGAPYPAELAPALGQINYLIQAQIDGANGQGFGDTDFDAFLPKLGLVYNSDANWNAAFTVQRGYRAGGVAVNPVRASADRYDPEFTWNYEASFRAAFADNRMLLRANTFYTDWSDQQITVALSGNNFDNTVINAGESRLYGAELELRGNLSKNWNLYTGLGYSNTRFESFVTPDGRDFTGNRFPGASEWSVTAGSFYQHGSGFTLQGDLNYLSDSFRNPDNSEIGTQDSRSLVNTKIGYQNKNWGLFLYSKNLLDEEYRAVGLVREGGLYSLGDPRTVGANLQLNF